MKLKRILAITAVSVLLLSAEIVQAGPRIFVGVGVGGGAPYYRPYPYYGPHYYPRPYYYAPPPPQVIYVAPPPIIVVPAPTIVPAPNVLPAPIPTGPNLNQTAYPQQLPATIVLPPSSRTIIIPNPASAPAPPPPVPQPPIR